MDMVGFFIALLFACIGVLVGYLFAKQGFRHREEIRSISKNKSKEKFCPSCGNQLTTYDRNLKKATKVKRPVHSYN